MALRFENDFLKKLEYLHILSKRVFAGQFRAERITKKRGSGLEFADHKPYTAGDDFRHIDWRAYQRLDRLLLRMFEEEQDMPVYLFIDTSRSMAEGNPSKLDYACHVAAALYHHILQRDDTLARMVRATHPYAHLRQGRNHIVPDTLRQAGHHAEVAGGIERRYRSVRIGPEDVVLELDADPVIEPGLARLPEVALKHRAGIPGEGKAITPSH